MEDVYLFQAKNCVLGVKSKHISNKPKCQMSFTPTSLSSTKNSSYYERGSPETSLYAPTIKPQISCMRLFDIKSNKTHSSLFSSKLREEMKNTKQIFPKYSNSSSLIFKHSEISRETNKMLETLNQTENKINNLSNTEEILDFFDYTEKCFKMIIKLPPKPNNSNSVVFQFENSDIKKKLAVFDIDETLIHCTGKINTNKDDNKKKHVIEILLPSKQKVKVGINIRPNWIKCLDLIKDKYHIVTYSASHSSYANAVLNYLDPDNKYFKFRLYRNHCILQEIEDKKFYVKDLDIFEGIDQKDIVIIDNSVLSFAYHLDNGIPVPPFYDNENDNELEILAFYLLNIYEKEDLREANKKNIKLDYFVTEARNEMNSSNSSSDDSDSESDSDNEEPKKQTENKKEPENCEFRKKVPLTRKNTIAFQFRNSMGEIHKRYQQCSMS